MMANPKSSRFGVTTVYDVGGAHFVELSTEIIHRVTTGFILLSPKSESNPLQTARRLTGGGNGGDGPHQSLGPV